MSSIHHDFARAEHAHRVNHPHAVHRLGDSTTPRRRRILRRRAG